MTAWRRETDKDTNAYHGQFHASGLLFFAPSVWRHLKLTAEFVSIAHNGGRWPWISFLFLRPLTTVVICGPTSRCRVWYDIGHCGTARGNPRIETPTTGGTDDVPDTVTTVLLVVLCGRRTRTLWNGCTDGRQKGRTSSGRLHDDVTWTMARAGNVTMPPR